MTETDLADAGWAPIEQLMQKQRARRCPSDPALINLRRDQSEKVLHSMIFEHVLDPSYGVLSLTSSPTPVF
jgi:hypothetical protein